MPAASWRTNPARSISLWDSASASAGSSRSVGTSDFASRMLVRVFRLVGALDARLVAQPLDRLAAEDVRLRDLGQVLFFHAVVPDVLRVDDDHRPVAALGEAPGLVDADLLLAPGLEHFRAQHLHELLDVALGRARLPAGA